MNHDRRSLGDQEITYTPTRLFEDSPIQSCQQPLFSQSGLGKKIQFEESHQPSNQQECIFKIQQLQSEIASKYRQVQEISTGLLRIHKLDSQYMELIEQKRSFAKQIIDYEYEIAVLERKLQIFHRNQSAVRVDDEDENQNEGDTFDNLRRSEFGHSAIKEVPEEQQESLIRASEIKGLSDCFSDKIRQSIRNSGQKESGKEIENTQKKPIQTDNIKNNLISNHYSQLTNSRVDFRYSSQIRPSRYKHPSDYLYSLRGYGFLESDQLYRQSLQRQIYLDCLSYDYLSMARMLYY